MTIRRRRPITSNDAEGRPRLWLVPIDRRSSPRQIPGVEGQLPSFGAPGEIYFLTDEGNRLHAVREDGTQLRRLTDAPAQLLGVSPDAQLMAVWLYDRGVVVFPASGGTPIPIWGRDLRLRWSADSRAYMSFSNSAGSLYGGGRTYVVPLAPGELLPAVPVGGFRSEAEIASLPNVRTIDAADVAPGPTGDVYAYSRITTQRNLYRSPIR